MLGRAGFIAARLSFSPSISWIVASTWGPSFNCGCCICININSFFNFFRLCRITSSTQTRFANYYISMPVGASQISFFLCMQFCEIVQVMKNISVTWRKYKVALRFNGTWSSYGIEERIHSLLKDFFCRHEMQYVIRVFAKPARNSMRWTSRVRFLDFQSLR